MSQVIKLNESNASLRIVYVWAVQSNGTSVAQFEAGGQPTMSVAGLTPWNSAGTLLSVNTTVGEYQVRLGTSDVSVLGPGIVRYSSGTALEVSIPLQIVGYDPYGSLSTFDPSAVSVGLKAVTHSGATVGVGGIAPATYSGVTVGVNNITAATYSGVTVGINNIAAGSYSGVTIAGVTRVNSNVTPADGTYSAVTVQVNGIAPAAYSGVTVGVGGIAPAAYSGVTVGVNNIAAGSYSGVTIAGVTRVNSSVTIADANYSAVTVRVGGIAPAEYSGVTVGVNSIAAGSYSDVTISGLLSAVTVGTGGIVAASFGAGAIDAAALATDAGQEIADRILLRSIAGGADSGRTVGTALYALRNRVRIDGSIGTVYRTDDATSSWTFSVVTTPTTSGLIAEVDPG